jgi:radical SAM superfamily enzyme YgiQ (UPF0313 family)
VKVLFVYPDFTLDIDPVTKRVQGLETGGWYMEGLACMSAVLKEKGHDVALYHILRPAERRSFVRRLEKEQPDLVGFTAGTRSFPFVKEYVRWVKDTLDVPIICGGYHPDSIPEEVAAVPEIDVVSLGEGEETMVELCDRLAAREPYLDLAGAWVKANGEVVRNPSRLLITDLDAMPLPDFALFNFDQLVGTAIGSGMAVLSRGCPYSCAYCINPRTRALFPNPKHYWRQRGPRRSIEYVQALLSHRPELQVIQFCSDMFGPDIPWLTEFSPLYKRKIGLPFTCNHRVNLITPELVRLLKDAGCYQIFLGIESGNEHVRNKVLNRNLSREKIVRAFHLCTEAGIKTVAYNMVGVPFEDNRAVLDTIKLNAEAKADHSLCPVYYPFPGTGLFEVAVENGFVPTSFDYRENRYLVQPTLPPAKLFFARYYFRAFVQAYRAAFRMPGPLRRLSEVALDALFLSRLLPRRPLTALARRWEAGFVSLKGLLRRYMPRLYMFGRDRIRGVRKAGRLQGPE